MVREEDGSAFVPVVEDLRLHTVETKADRDEFGVFIGRQKVCKRFPNLVFKRQRRRITRPADADRDTADAPAVCKKAFIDQFGDVL